MTPRKHMLSRMRPPGYQLLSVTGREALLDALLDIPDDTKSGGLAPVCARLTLVFEVLDKLAERVDLIADDRAIFKSWRTIELGTMIATMLDLTAIAERVLDAFDIARHNDHSYKPPTPWTQWDSYANCWVCEWCGAAAGYQRHNDNCVHEAKGLS